jgi:hypothetical protein
MEVNYLGYPIDVVHSTLHQYLPMHGYKIIAYKPNVFYVTRKHLFKKECIVEISTEFRKEDVTEIRITCQNSSNNKAELQLMELVFKLF